MTNMSNGEMPTQHYLRAGILLKRLEKDGIALGVIFLIAAAVHLPFWQSGIANANDMLASIYRLYALDTSLENGILYPRWAPDFAFGYGAALFAVYAPLVYYVAIFFHLAGLGFIASTKATFLFGSILSGGGMYLYGFTLWRSRLIAVLMATVYIFAPYQLLNIYERGALPEFFSWAILPWVLWTFHHLYTQGGYAWLLFSASTLAALILTHNATGPVFLPILVGYIGVLFLGERQRQRLVICLAAVGLGLGLSFFFLLPAIIESQFIDLAHITGLGRDPVSNLVSIENVIQRTWLVDYWGPERFRASLVVTLLASLGWVIALVRLIPQRSVIVFWGLVWSSALALQLDAAQIFWEQVPWIRVIQFPWRLLGFVSVSNALFIGALAFVIVRLPIWQNYIRKYYKPASVALIVLMGMIVIVTAVARLSPIHSAIWYKIEEEDINRFSLYERGRTYFDLFADYKPIWVKEQITNLPASRTQPPEVLLPPLNNAPRIQVIRYTPMLVRLMVESTESFPLRYHRFYFPGWQVMVDDHPVPTFPSGELGLVTADIPAGKHFVELIFVDTLIRQIGAWVSLISLLVVFGILLWWLKRFWVVGLLVLALVGGIITWQIRPLASSQWDELQVNLENQVIILGYSLDKDHYAPGETIHLTLYGLGLRQMTQDYQVFVHLVDERTQEKITQNDSVPGLGFSPTSRWEPGELIVDEHFLVLDETVASGVFQLVVGMYQPEEMRNLEAYQPSPFILPGNRILLTSIQVKGR